MTQRYRLGTCLLYLFLSWSIATVSAQSTGGWTALNPANASKMVYVSASDGNDGTAQVYAPTSATVGSDPFHPAGSVRAFRTVAAALSQTSEGEAAWVLLKRGDVFYEGLETRSGASPSRPFLYASYGSSRQPPLLKTGANSGFSHCCNSLNNFWVVGLSFYAHTRNPDDPDYRGPSGSSGFRFYSGEGHSTTDILIEGCVFRFYESNAINGPGHYTNIRVRRNMIFDNYSVEGHAQGFYASHLNGLQLEENIFDHNGWYKQQSVSGQQKKEEGQATMFNHNTYFADNQNVVFSKNSFYRPSSIGNKWTANQGEASTSNIKIIDNLYHDFEIGISIGGNKSDPPYRFKDITLSGNVFSNPNLSRPTNRSLGWMIDINDWDNGVCSNNYLLHQRQDKLGNARGIRVEGQNRNLQVRNNVLYNLKNSTYIEVVGTDFVSTKISGNTLTFPASQEQYYVSSQPAAPPAIFSSNVYSAADQYAQSFRVGSSRVGYSPWVAAARESGASVAAPDYVDPDRDVLTYVSHVLGLRSMDAFYQELRKQSYLNWREEYTTEAIIRWIKAGYESPDKRVPVQGATLNDAPATLAPGDQQPLSYSIRPANATNTAVRWSSSVPSVATVSSRGVVTALAVGSTIITVTTQDGNQTDTFRLTVAKTSSADNVALRKPVTVSSAPQPQNSGSKITDGVVGTGENRWSAYGMPQSATIDLQDRYLIQRSELFPYQNRAYQYTIEVSTDGRRFTRVADRSNNAQGGNVLTDSFSATARYVRYTVSGARNYSGPWVSFREVKIYGQAVENEQNIALNKPVSVSSAPELEHGARLLTDGVSDVAENRWSANTYSQSATINLQAVYFLHRTVLYPLASRAYQYTVEVSTDGKTFTRVADRRSNTQRGGRLTDSFSATGRYVRFTVTGASAYTGSWVSLLEAEVFGTPLTTSSRQTASLPVTKRPPEQGQAILSEAIVAYPNPVIVDEIRFDRPASGTLLDSNGKAIVTFEQVTRLDASGLLTGLYMLRFRSGQSMKVLKEP